MYEAESSERTRMILRFPCFSSISPRFVLFGTSLGPLWVLFGSSESEVAMRSHRGSNEVPSGRIGFVGPAMGRFWNYFQSPDILSIGSLLEVNIKY
jgi:hypothetical protein